VETAPLPANGFLSFLISVYLLEIVGACAVTALGWVACRTLDVVWWPSAPLWFSGYLLVYNLDRLYPDPADHLNTPIRTEFGRRLRPFRIIFVLASGLMMMIWPVVTGRPWLALLLVLAAVGLQYYSRPIPFIGYRLKDLPYLKSLVAPLVIAMILVIWPSLENGHRLDSMGLTIFAWCFCILTINSLVFDYRDIDGDRVTRTRTIPATLGQRRTTVLLTLLAVTLFLLSQRVFAVRPDFLVMPVALGIGSALLLLSLKRAPTPMAISFFADLLLFIPLLVELLKTRG
jgi:4-hydroxybenzoate polyprenyltransferase